MNNKIKEYLINYFPYNESLFLSIDYIGNEFVKKKIEFDQKEVVKFQ